MNIQAAVIAVQAELKKTNPSVVIDGKDGPQTWQAIYERITGKLWRDPATTTFSNIIAATNSGTELIAAGDKVDDRSEKNIATLLMEARPYARALVHKAAAQGIEIRVISGTRSYEEQNQLFRQCCDGKDNDGDGRIDEADEKVTKARGGFSNHNFGIAFDIGIFEGSKYIPESPLYKVVMSMGRQLGLKCGGDWVSFRDEPHYEYNPKNYTIAQLRERKAAGLPLV